MLSCEYCVSVSHCICGWDFIFILYTGVTHPAGLDDLVVTVEAVLNLHQLLEVILKKNNTREMSKKTRYRSRG